MFQHKSFNPKVIILDHFDEVKNQIDIRTETILHEKRNILSENRQQCLNDLRQNLLNLSIRQKNFYLLSQFLENLIFRHHTHHMRPKAM